MKNIRVSVVCAAVGSIVLAGAAMAHHGDADRYNDNVVTVSGTIVELQMTNPHAIIVFDADRDGKKVRWQAELGGPQQLQRQFGWTRSTIKPGEKITLTGRQAKSGAPYLNLTERANIVLADSGKEIYRTANYGEPPPPPGTGTSSIN
jgi:hypothetical protein